MVNTRSYHHTKLLGIPKRIEHSINGGSHENTTFFNNFINYLK